VPSVKSINEFTSKKDFIIFATKAYDTVKYVKEALPHLSNVGAIVTLQNTFCADRLLRLIPHEKSICVYMDIYCKSYPQGKYVVDTGGFTLGVYNKEAFSKMKVLSKILGDIAQVKQTNNVFGFVLGRNILCGAIALLGAISGLNLGKILKDKNGRFLFNKLIEESLYVATRYKIKVLPYDDKLDYYLFTSKTLAGIRYNKLMTKVLIQNNRNIKSSFLTAIERNKKTELEFLLGNMYSYSSKNNSKTPYINAIYKMTKEIENGTRRVDKNVFKSQIFEDIKNN